MPWVGFETTIPASERAKTVHALDRSATVTGGCSTIATTKYPQRHRNVVKVMHHNEIHAAFCVGCSTPQTSTNSYYTGAEKLWQMYEYRPSAQTYSVISKWDRYYWCSSAAESRSPNHMCKTF
jgi:hypothetical protein